MNGRENTILLAASLAAALALGVLALALGQDANWDLRNYHLYNPYAWLEGRRGFDLLPAGRPSFYNPFLHLPFWLLSEALPAKGVAFVLGAAQGGLAFALIAAIAQRLLTEGPWRLPLALACAATASLGGGAVGLLGTSFMDNVLGFFALGAVLILMGEVGAWRLLSAGLLIGVAVGLKLTMGLYAVGIGLAMAIVLWRSSGPAHMTGALLLFGLGGALGIALGGGYWMATLWRDYANPIFPHFNQVFVSPWAPVRSGHDPMFLPKLWWEGLVYPFVFALDGTRVGEAPFRDIRFALFEVLLIVGLIAFRRGEARLVGRDGVFLVALVAATYVAWQVIFSIYRYAVPLEQLAPLAILVLVDRWPLGEKGRAFAAMLLFTMVIAAALPANWGRQTWSGPGAEGDVVGLTPPSLAEPHKVLVVMAGYQPMAYAITRFPKDARFVRVTSSFSNPGETDRLTQTAEAAIRDHAGPIYLLHHDHEGEVATQALAHFRLKADFAACVGLPNRLDQTLRFCPVSRDG